MYCIVKLDTLLNCMIQIKCFYYFLSLDDTVANLSKIPTSFVRKNMISKKENIDAPIISPIQPPNWAAIKCGTCLASKWALVNNGLLSVTDIRFCFQKIYEWRTIKYSIKLFNKEDNLKVLTQKLSKALLSQDIFRVAERCKVNLKNC
jgi:hypothetical protein